MSVTVTPTKSVGGIVAGSGESEIGRNKSYRRKSSETRRRGRSAEITGHRDGGGGGESCPVKETEQEGFIQEFQLLECVMEYTM